MALLPLVGEEGKGDSFISHTVLPSHIMRVVCLKLKLRLLGREELVLG